jgi:DNA adenine methylase
MEQKDWKTCKICNGLYPADKHNFVRCYPLDHDWDILVTGTTHKPFLKWVGGKTQILPYIRNQLTGANFDTYYEPFIGGGSVLLMVISMIESNTIHLKKIIASDINWQLICVYNYIKNKPYELMGEIDRLYKKYEDAPVIEYEKRHKVDITTLENAISKGKKYVYYYFRKQYNSLKNTNVTVAALFIILNKLCFRGLYRTGKNGFNTPYGNYITPCIYNTDNILKLNYVFNRHNVIFKHQSYEVIKPTHKDLLYMDPPYYPIRKKAFESYSEHEFNHDKLVLFTKQCKNFIQSNAWCDFTVNQYKQYSCKKILCKRRINSKKPEDTDYEIMILSKSLHRI